MPEMSLADLARFGITPEMSPLQQRAAIATRGVAGSVGADPEALRSWGSLVSGMAPQDLLPIETQWLGSFGATSPETKTVTTQQQTGRHGHGRQNYRDVTSTVALSPAERLSAMIDSVLSGTNAPTNQLTESGIGVTPDMPRNARLSKAAQLGINNPTAPGLFGYFSNLAGGLQEPTPGEPDYQDKLRQLYSRYLSV